MVTPGALTTDPILKIRMDTVENQGQLVEAVRLKRLATEVEAEKKTLDEQLIKAEADLSHSITVLTDYVAVSNAEVKEGTEAFEALKVVNTNLTRINDTTVLRGARKELNTIATRSSDAFKPALNNVLATRFGEPK
jgi:hypothetical protein